MDIPVNTPLGSAESITGKLMVLFSPSPLSFYRVNEYDDLETAKKWCEGFASIPSQQNYVRLIVCDAINWQDFAAGTLFDINHNKRHKYMVLWKLMEPCYYKMREFEQLHDGVHCASATRIRLQEMQASQQVGLPESVQLFAFTLAGEWNPANKPDEACNPFSLRFS